VSTAVLFDLDGVLVDSRAAGAAGAGRIDATPGDLPASL